MPLFFQAILKLWQTFAQRARKFPRPYRGKIFFLAQLAQKLLALEQDEYQVTLLAQKTERVLYRTGGGEHDAALLDPAGKALCARKREARVRRSPAQAEQLFLVTVDLSVPVICYGLRADFMMHGFPGSTRLLELAHTIEELKTICACGRKAICNGRKVNGEYVFEGAQVAIDTVDNVEYQSLCPQCWYREYRAFLKRHGKG